jgi:hypothetical protein
MTPPEIGVPEDSRANYMDSSASTGVDFITPGLNVAEIAKEVNHLIA